jgi:hypothetical protein
MSDSPWSARAACQEGMSSESLEPLAGRLAKGGEAPCRELRVAYLVRGPARCLDLPKARAIQFSGSVGALRDKAERIAANIHQASVTTPPEVWALWIPVIPTSSTMASWELTANSALFVATKYSLPWKVK